MGYVMRVSEEDRMSMSRAMLIDTIAVALAGRAAEEIVFNDVTTGAANDFQQATNIARRMVSSWGMSDSLGKIALSSSNESYLGEYEGARTYSEETARLIDNEVKAIIDAQYERVLALLQENRATIDTIVEVLLERETLHADDFEKVMRGEPLPPYEGPLELPETAAPQAAPPEVKPKGPLLPPGMMPKPG